MCFFLTAWIFGDPHFTTLDGDTYTFNGHGEYILVKLADNNFQIQCRTIRATKSDGNSSEATIFSAFVVQAENVWLQIELNANKSGVNVFAGQNASYWSDYTTDYNSANFSLTSVSGLDLIRENNTAVALFIDTGMLLSLDE